MHLANSYIVVMGLLPSSLQLWVVFILMSHIISCLNNGYHIVILVLTLGHLFQMLDN